MPDCTPKDQLTDRYESVERMAGASLQAQGIWGAIIRGQFAVQAPLASLVEPKWFHE